MTPLPATPNRPERRLIDRCGAATTPTRPNKPEHRTAPNTATDGTPSRAQAFKTSLLQGLSRVAEASEVADLGDQSERGPG